MTDPTLDELFGEEGGAPEPRSTTIVALLAAGLTMTILGLACSSAPGGMLVLLAWYLVGKDMDRLDNGYLPADARPRVRRLQHATWASVAVVLVAFGVQAWLLGMGVYDLLWGVALQAVGRWVGAA